MGDMSAEPSMEEILSSIKRIIAEEGDGTQTRARRTQRASAPEPEPEHEDEEVLELSEPMTEPEAAPRAQPQAQAQPQATPQRTPVSSSGTTGHGSGERILSQRAAAASLGSLETLSKLLVKPEPESDGTLEGLVREMLRPMLRDWLDTHLPDMVETLVAREIAKITSQVR